MKAQQVDYDKEADEIAPAKDPAEQDWVDVCERFSDDVHRIRGVEGKKPYTALYVCFDEDDKPEYYLVEEDRKLNRLRHRVFLEKLGRTK